MSAKEDEKPKDPKEWLSARNVLWVLVFVGFAVNYMIRINLNIALVSMIKIRSSNGSFEEELSNTATLTDISLQEFNETSTVSVEEVRINSPLFDWDEKKQSQILGSFFWMHWITQIPGGVLGSKYGTKAVFGLANFTGVVCCFVIPLMAKLGSGYLIALRIFQGALCGFAWPAMHDMTARWIPPNERSKFVTAYLGSSVGAALTYPICGFIIDRWGWEVVFYSCGVLGTLWYTAWLLLVYDSPSKHPRISPAEKHYILESIGGSFAAKKASVPWRKIVTSVPVCMNCISQIGGIWGFFTLMTFAPTYFRFIHNWNIRATGVLSGLPHLLRMIWAYIFSLLSDYLLQANKMSRTNVRKLATAVCTIGQGVFMLGLSFSGFNKTAAIVFLTGAIAINGAVSSGPLASVVDMSPNYASVVLGLMNTIVAVVGIICPAIVGHLTFQNNTVGQYQKVFWIATSVLFITGICYVLFAKSELQSWNSPKISKNVDAELLEIKDKEKLERDEKTGLLIK